jgi:myo-inositol-1(or 4)-monophosphatase
MTNAVDELRSIAADIAREGGALAARRRKEGVSVAGSKSSDEDIVTLADREVESFIRQRLFELRPNDGFFGEEGARDSSASGLTWVVDPIDGTVNYLYKIGFYGVSIAVVEGDADPSTWTALAGAVMSPIADELFTATNGGGAFLNGTPIRVNADVPLNLALVATGFAYSADVRGEQAEALTRVVTQVRDIRRLGACSIDLCSLAAGRVDAYFERELSPWDYAAGGLIAREAGARVEGVNGAPATGEMLIAADPSLFPSIHALITD